jgi:hypothetical protein
MIGSMSSVIHYEINYIFSTTCKCQDLIKDKLTIQNQINKENIVSVFTNDGKRDIDPLFQGNKQIGQNNWHVLYKGNDFNNERFQKLENRITELEKKVGKLDNIIVNELVESAIRNTATNIILFFLGEQPKENTKSHRFKDKNNSNKLSEFIEKYNIEYNSKTLGNNFDEIINSRNVCIHPCNLQELLENVKKCKKYIEEYPNLEKKFKYEIFTIQHYNEFLESVIIIL